MNMCLYDKKIRHIAAQEIRTFPLLNPTVKDSMENMLCGDSVIFEVQSENGVITEFSHRTEGCILCRAASNIIADHVVGQDIVSIQRIINGIKSFLKDGHEINEEAWVDIIIFKPLVNYKNRRRCVLLPFQLLEKVVRSL